MTVLSEDERQVQAVFGRIADELVAPGAKDRDQESRFPYDIIDALAATQVFGLPFAEDLGGQGGSSVDFVLALEEIARADQSVAALVANQVGLAGMPLARFGSESQQSRWLPSLFSGETLGAFGLTEASGGSDTRSMRTMARKEPGGWRLSGSKAFITNAGTERTGFVTVAARTTDEAGAESGFGMFLVESGSEGFAVGPALRKIGWRSSDTRDVYLDGCFVPDSNVLGDSSRGRQQFLEALEFGRIQIATLAVGLVAAALDVSLRYAEERQAFGKRLIDFQAIQFKLADMATECEASRLLVHNAARLRDQGEPFANEAAMAKLFASESAARASTQCVQILGGAGFMDDSAAARLFRDSKILEIGEGTSEIQRVLIARSLDKAR